MGIYGPTKVCSIWRPFLQIKIIQIYLCVRHDSKDQILVIALAPDRRSKVLNFDFEMFEGLAELKLTFHITFRVDNVCKIMMLITKALITAYSVEIGYNEHHGIINFCSL